MNKEELQYDLLKTELELTQRQVDKYDEMSTKVKTWAITLWAASVGWSFQVNRGEVLLLSILILTVFWFFDALNKTFRMDYKKRRDEVAEALEFVFRTGTTPQNFSAPRLPLHSLGETVKNIIVPHVALPYLLLALVSYLLYIRLWYN